MTHSQTHAGIAIGATVLIGVVIAFLPPVPPASAQNQAQRICREEVVKPPTETYEYCLSQATRALEWGEPTLARGFARVAAEERDACLGYEMQPQTDGLQALHLEQNRCPLPVGPRRRAAPLLAADSKSPVIHGAGSPRQSSQSNEQPRRAKWRSLIYTGFH